MEEGFPESIELDKPEGWPLWKERTLGLYLEKNSDPHFGLWTCKTGSYSTFNLTCYSSCLHSQVFELFPQPRTFFPQAFAWLRSFTFRLVQGHFLTRPFLTAILTLALLSTSALFFVAFTIRNHLVDLLILSSLAVARGCLILKGLVPSSWL